MQRWGQEESFELTEKRIKLDKTRNSYMKWCKKDLNTEGVRA